MSMGSPRKCKFRCLGLVGFLLVLSGMVWGEVPKSRWAAVVAYGGGGVRYTPTRPFNLESRVLFGDGMAVSVRGAFQWDREDWKFRPLAGLEFSVLAPVHGKGERGETLALFMGGEVRLAPRLTFQLDVGPAALRIQEENSKKEEWDYQNVLNVSLNWYFGKLI